MKFTDWGLISGLVIGPTNILAQNVVTKTISINTGTCAAASGTGGPYGYGGNGSGTGSSALPSASALPTGGSGGGNGSESSNSSTPTIKLQVYTDPGLYYFVGFYPITATGSLQKRAGTYNGFETVESCGYSCRYSPYFALELGDTCICSNTLPTSTPVQDPSSLIPCAGDTTEVCGAAGYAIFYGGTPSSTSEDSDQPMGPVTSSEIITTTNSLGSTTVETIPTIVSTLSSVGSSTFEPSTAINSGASVVLTSAVSDVTTTNSLGSTVVESVTLPTSQGAVSPSVGIQSSVVSSSTSSAAAASSPSTVAASSSSAAAVGAASTTAGTSPSAASAGPSVTAAVGSRAGSIGPSTTVHSSSTTVHSSSTTVHSSSTTVHLSSTTVHSSSTTVHSPSTTVHSPSTAVLFPAEPTLIATPTCFPASGSGSNNTRYVDLFDETYDIRCGLNIVGTSFSSAHADTFLRCLQYCDLLDGCTAATYVDGNNKYNNNTNCYSYSTFTGHSYTKNNVFWSGSNVNGASTGATDPTSGDSTNTNLCATGANDYDGSPYGPDVYGNCYEIGCDHTINQSGDSDDLTPTVMSSLLGCSLYCSFYNNCISVTYTGTSKAVNGKYPNNCFPKATYNTTVATTNKGTSYAYQGHC